ncbi:ExbD/TolR family protein [Merismopedia glauca]|uniref:Biopolymer transporter ExbD n=1 Tax=Merismopedia glauca CCAP 1448/3 TaxID=1296344 RepID=A0A2T1C0Q4_9CYAN|nr:biopolymer transporter ExbD [Merismopedia glauca]PSB01747.1 biopolymer transporter ExbD [Merismopedia glauca CCAP 1448/3]
MRLPEEPDIPSNINIIPMIDVVFSILTFFIFSSLFLSRSQGLDVNLPKAGTAQAQKNEQINVTIKSDGTLALNRQPIPIEQLQPAIQGLVKPNSESLVVINADEKVNHGQVVTVMDKVRQIPQVKLAIAAQKQ